MQSQSYSRLRGTARSWWGDIQRSRTLAPGVLSVSTGGHGGILVDPAVYPLHPALRDGLDGYIQRWTWQRTGDEAYRIVGFEEDCGWAPLLLAHPDLLRASIRKEYMAGDMTEDTLRKHALCSAAHTYPAVLEALGINAEHTHDA